jgi:hypothetical protein
MGGRKEGTEGRNRRRYGREELKEGRKKGSEFWVSF